MAKRINGIHKKYIILKNPEIPYFIVFAVVLNNPDVKRINIVM